MWGEMLRRSKKVTLHHLRLAVADHLDIPFQEVVSVSLTLSGAQQDPAQGLRRLAVMAALLNVRVETRRVEQDSVLDDVIEGTVDASHLLGLKVNIVEPIDSETAEKSGAITEHSDPYIPAYDALAKKDNRPALVTSPANVLPLPTEAIIALAAAVLVLGSALGCYMYIKQRAGTQSEPLVQGKEIDEVEAAKIENSRQQQIETIAEAALTGDQQIKATSEEAAESKGGNDAPQNNEFQSASI
jgi:hypothetical protein